MLYNYYIHYTTKEENNMNNKLSTCSACGNEIAKSAKSCPHCGAKNKKPVFKKVWFWVLIFFIIGAVATPTSTTIESNNTVATSPNQTQQTNATISTQASIFDGDCGINASAEIGKNIINLPEITIKITNTTDKEIAAIQFYAVPYDVYGDEIKNWTTQSKLYTDTAISAGDSTTLSYQLIEDSVKTVDLYVYSVYFSDGTEWGDKNASVSKILENVPTIEVTSK